MLLLFIRIPGFAGDAITVSIVFAGPAGRDTHVPTSKRFRDYVCEKKIKPRNIIDERGILILLFIHIKVIKQLKIGHVHDVLANNIQQTHSKTPEMYQSE